MESGVVLHRARDRRVKHSLTHLLRYLIGDRSVEHADYDPGAAKKRLIGRALTRGEQRSYARAVDTEREIQQSALRTSRESTARACRDLETGVGIFRDSSIREARRFGRIFFEVRQRLGLVAAPVVQIKKPTSA